MVYVHNIVIGTSSVIATDEVKYFQKSRFKLKDSRGLKYFLGLEITRSSKRIFLCQRIYKLDLLNEYGSLGSKSTSTLVDYNTELTKAATHDTLVDATLYKRLVGKLLYLTFSKLDITYVVKSLSQFMDKPSTTHLQAAYRVLKYLKKASRQGILLAFNSNIQEKVFTDSDWVGCLDSRRFVTGFGVFLGKSLISW